MSWIFAISFIIAVVMVIIICCKKRQTYILYSTDDCIMFTKKWPSRASIIWKKQDRMIKTSLLESTYLVVTARDMQKQLECSPLFRSKNRTYHNQVLEKLYEAFIFAVSHRGDEYWEKFFALENRAQHLKNIFLVIFVWQLTVIMKTK